MKLGIVLCATSFLTACTSIGVTTIKKAEISQSEDCELAIYTEQQEVQGSYQVLCLIDVMTPGHVFADTTVAGALRSARPIACGCGADGILIQEVRRDGGNLWGRGYATVKAIRLTSQSK